LRIAVDATCWQNNRGYGRYVRSLLSTLVRLDARNHYTFLVDSSNGHGQPLPPRAEVRRVGASVPAVEAASADGHRSVGDLWRMSRAASAPGFDLLFFPTVYSYVPVLSRARKVLMIMDVIAEKFPQLTVPGRLNRLFWKAKVAMGRRQADALVTLSDHSRAGIVEHFRVAPERVHVIGAASDPVFRVLEEAEPTPHLTALGLGGPGRTVAYVGGFSPHKNLTTLVSAFAAVAAGPEFADVRLALVGEYQKEVFHSQYATIRDQVERLGLAGRVVFTGYLPDEEVVVLLNRAVVLALPSLLEGFGLPAIEAAACGCPVLATTASPLPSLLGAGGLFLDPLDATAWARALADVLSSAPLRERMRAAALDAAPRLTWDTVARRILAVLDEVAGQ
jgi:glycosyltransferase involved in cell wall biosynthesis